MHFSATSLLSVAIAPAFPHTPKFLYGLKLNAVMSAYLPKSVCPIP